MACSVTDGTTDGIRYDSYKKREGQNAVDRAKLKFSRKADAGILL